MKFQFAIIIIVFILCDIIAASTSMYEGVSWNEKRNQWQVESYIYGKKQKSYFDNKIDANKKLEKLCGKIEISPQNPEIDEIPNQQEKKQTSSKYTNVYWKRENRKWCVQFWVKGGKQFGGCFNDELDAAKRVNQLCEEMGIPPKNPAITAMPNQQYQYKGKTSQYKGVFYNKQARKWIARLHLKGQTPKYSGHFNDEIDAAKKVNELCKELGITPHNPGISAIPDEEYKPREKTSKYKGVSHNKQTDKWFARLYLKGQTPTYGGMFEDELNAAKKVNQLCEDLGIPLQNFGIEAISTQQSPKKEKTSQYKGVHWDTKTGKWKVHFVVKGEYKFGGLFDDELDAAKKVNKLCQALGIPHQNPTVGIMQNQIQGKKQKKSQYQSVYWNRDKGKWFVSVALHKGKRKYGGYFNDELDAVKKVNQLCEEIGIPLQNSSISTLQNHKYQKTLCNDDSMQAQFTSLINILDKNNDTIAATITKDILEAINDGEQAIMTQINLCTKNGESALCIAAKHGFSNAVKFLISKGAEKEHFTNKHHTPLSLAVSYNHLKVVQVLFEDWISPNSHEKPYLHLSPIFNVKSREIAQLLIDNDAVTHDIYNDKHQSPLTVACQNGYLDVVEFFLDDELDISHLDSDNKTSLFYALANKHHDIANLLILKGAQN